MQANVHTFDETTRSGTVLLDDGREHAFSAEIFGASALRHLRVGQRVSVEIGPHEIGPDAGGRAPVTRLWIVGIGPGERID